MKKQILIFTMLFANIIAFSQVDWTYFSEEPILSMEPETFVWGAYGQPTVIIHNDTIKMWYAVAETGEFDPVVRGRIHYAWSLDGFEWTKYHNNPVLDVGEEGEWDNAWLDTPGILWDGNEFKLYYYGDSTYAQGQDNTAIGMATSDDGINWVKHGVVLEMGEPDSWEGHHIELPAVHYVESSELYAMLYSGMDRANYPLPGFIQIGLALSFDGYDWFKWPDNPVVEYGAHPSWNDIGVAGSAFIETDGIFEMWFTGIQIVEEPHSSWDSLKVGYAVTLNGTSWIKYPGNPVLTANPGDSTVFWAFDVIWDDSDELYKMYFESEHWHYQDPYDPDTTHAINAIFYATAPRTVMFSPDCDISISENTTINPGDNVQLQASGGDYYQWEPPDGLSNPDIANPIASPEETSTYTVLIVSETCITKAEVTVTVDDASLIINTSEKELNVYPNPLSNSNAINFNKILNKKRISITNNLGEIVFYKDDFSGNEILLNKSLKTGVYLIEIRGNDESLYKKLIVD
jgi:predicted GH43/DUF377 family glycosyl hydrolase